MLAIPIIGTWVYFTVFGGDYPGELIVGRLYIIHVLLVPAIILALITVHLLFLVKQKHTQFPGPGRTEHNVVGNRLFPTFAAKATGLFFVVFGDFVNVLWIIFLGWFIRSGAETSLRQTRLTESLAGVRVGDIMTKELLSVSPDASVQQLVSDYFLVHPHGGYPVVSNGKLLGVVTMSSVRSIPREKREIERVTEAMVPYERTVTVSPTTLAIDALQLMAKNLVGRLVVMDGDRIAGMVTRGDLMKTMKARQDLGLWDHTHV